MNEDVAMDIGEEDTTAGSGFSHHTKGRIDRIGIEIIGDPFPEKQGAQLWVKPGRAQSRTELMRRQIDGDKDHMRRNGVEHVAEGSLFCCQCRRMIHFKHTDRLHLWETIGTSIKACSQDDDLLEARRYGFLARVVDVARASNA